MANSPYDDVLEGLGLKAKASAPAEQEKGVQLRGRDINGTYYIRAEDVVGLLEANKVLPKITKLIKSKLR